MKPIQKFLEKRIAETEKERASAEKPEIQRSKGAKLTAYREILQYIKALEEKENKDGN